MEQIIDYNRKTFASVNQWITQEVWINSIFNYGVPKHVLPLLDLPVGSKPIETDLLCSIIKHCANVKYLEIGVSVGKNMYAVIKLCEEFKTNCVIDGLDIEKINPIFESRLLNLDMFNVVKTIEIDNNVKTTKTSEKNSITKYNRKSTNNLITYYEADEFSNIWQHMVGCYNIIFSDALHHPSALLWEYKSLNENKKLDTNGFIYCFDDLEDDMNGPMHQAVKEIHENIKKDYGYSTIKYHKIGGWLGENEHLHNFAVITFGQKAIL